MDDLSLNDEEDPVLELPGDFDLTLFRSEDEVEGGLTVTGGRCRVTGDPDLRSW